MLELFDYDGSYKNNYGTLNGELKIFDPICLGEYHKDFEYHTYESIERIL